MSRTFINKKLSQDIAKSTGNIVSIQEETYIIPNESLLYIDRFYGGMEYTTGESRVELIHRSNSIDTIIDIGYSSNFDRRDLGEFLGNGSDQIVLRLYNADKSSGLHMTGMWTGFIEVNEWEKTEQ